MHVQGQAQKEGEEDPILQNYQFVLNFITKHAIAYDVLENNKL
jgi:hypothetical protein